jgi:chaperonin GroES
MRLRPLADRIIVSRLEAEVKSPGGILLPDGAKEKPLLGHVLAVGPGKKDEDGSRHEMDVKEGDLVLFTKYGGHQHKLDGSREVMILQESDVLCVVETDEVELKAVG